MVRYCLQRSGYKEVAPGEKTSQECAAYIKVDAGLPPAVLKTYIRQAFNQGQIVWLDEINSIIETIGFSDGVITQWLLREDCLRFLSLEKKSY